MGAPHRVHGKSRLSGAWQWGQTNVTTVPSAMSKGSLTP